MKKILPVILVILVGVYLSFVILKTEKTVVNNEHHEEKDTKEIPKGIHKGKLFTKDNFSLEITIYETDIPPEFRVFILDKEKPVNLDEVNLTVELKRVNKTDLIKFKKHGSYLLGNQEIVEPHSFDVKIMTSYKGKNYVWAYPSYEGRTEISQEGIKRSAIEIEAATLVRLENKIELPAEIALNADRVSHVVPQLSGVVSQVFKNLGDTINKGELLAVINSRDLAEAKREYIESVHYMELVKLTFERENNLWKKKINSEEEFFKARHTYEESKITKNVAKRKLLTLGLSESEINSTNSNSDQNLARYEIRAPFSGVVIEKHISIGEALKADSDIFMIADLSTVWANITVYAKDLKNISAGENITISSETLNKTATGKIIFVGSLVGEKTRSAKAYAVINNASGIWKPGLFVTAKISSKENKPTLVVKASSVQNFRDWDVVFINSGNIFQAQPVELGKQSGEWIEILSGLSVGAKYVSKNSYILKADIEKSGASHDH